MVKIVNYQFDGDYEYTLTGRCRAATQQSEDTRSPTTITGPSEVDILLLVQPAAIVQPTLTLHTNAPTHTIYTHRYSTHLYNNIQNFGVVWLGIGTAVACFTPYTLVLRTGLA